MRARAVLGATRRLGIGVRVALFLGVALLPVGLIAVWQTLEVSRVAQERSELALMALTERSTVSERRFIQRALGSARALASNAPYLAEDVERCSQVMRAFASAPAMASYSFAGYAGRDGALRCSSTGEGFDFSGTPTFDDFVANPRVRVTANRAGPLSGQSVVVVTHPVLTAEGAFDGFVSISMPHSRLEAASDTIEGIELMTFNAEGEVLTATSGLEGVERRLPARRSLAELAGRPADVLSAADGLGRERVFAVVPILSGVVYALGSWEGDAPLGTRLHPTVPPWVFPILMLAVSLVVAYVAVHRLVIRHMVELRRRMREFAEHRRLPRDDLAFDAPAEIAEMDGAFAVMAERILREEAETEDRLHEQKVLLREVHHRVKNNLQLISSIINMQMRQIDAPAARHVLRRVQDRVLGLATIHRNLYQTDAGTIRADVVLREIVDQLALMGAPPEGEARVESDFEPLELYPDQAVPLSLFVTEATTNAVKYVGRPEDGSRPWIAVTLRCEDDGSARVSIANSRGTPLRAPAAGEDGTGLGNQLIRAFAMQLDAAPTVEEEPDSYRIGIRFVPAGFEDDAQAGPEASQPGLQAAE